MLPDNTEECPRCGTRLGSAANGEGFSRSDVLLFSIYTIGVVLIPILVGVGIGLLCISLFLTR